MEAFVRHNQPGDAPLPAIHEPAVYRVRVAGRLGHDWGDRVGAMRSVIREGGPHSTVTELTGPVADQAALQGLLDLLYARGCVLLSVDLLSQGGPVQHEPCER